MIQLTCELGNPAHTVTCDKCGYFVEVEAEELCVDGYAEVYGFNPDELPDWDICISQGTESECICAECNSNEKIITNGGGINKCQN